MLGGFSVPDVTRLQQVQVIRVVMLQLWGKFETAKSYCLML